MPQQFSTLLLLVVMFGAFYLLMIRPAQKRRKAQLDTLSSLQAGSRVLLASGFHATVLEVTGDTVLVELGPGTEATVVKQAVVQVIADDAPVVPTVASLGQEQPSDPEPIEAEPAGSEPTQPHAADPIDPAEGEQRPTDPRA